MIHRINIVFLTLAIGLILLFFRESPYLVELLILVGVIFFIFLSVGVIWLRANYFLTAINQVSSPYVLLTFDDGPNPEVTPAVLRILQDHGVKAMFFVIGEKALKNPELILKIKEEGHLIGNHTSSHLPLFALSSEKNVLSEIKEGNSIISQITGEDTPWFRPPIGYTNPIIARVVRKLSLVVIGWNVRSFDTVIQDPEKLKTRLLKLTKPGSVILLHDNLPQTGEMLNDYILSAKKNGIIFADDSCINLLLK